MSLLLWETFAREFLQTRLSEVRQKAPFTLYEPRVRRAREPLLRAFYRTGDDLDCSTRWHKYTPKICGVLQSSFHRLCVVRRQWRRKDGECEQSE